MPSRKGIPRWIEIHEKDSPRGWSIVIMPHEIIIDSHHGTPHIHPPRKEGNPVDILARSMGQVREIVYRHSERKQNVVYQELLEELR